MQLAGRRSEYAGISCGLICALSPLENISAVEYSPFYGIEKGAVLQEARIFHDPNLDTRRCSQVITKLLYLLHQGETFTKKEASDVFFAATKLFQAKDPHLRRMVYLLIKDICPGSDEVIIVTSSLMKDINSKVELYRSNAVRMLCQIVDSQLLAQIERYLKQAVADKSPVVAASVLVSALHLMHNNAEIIKRWVNEVQEAVQSKHSMVQFHAVALLHALRASDRLAVSKLVSQLTRSAIKSPLAQCLLVRYVSQVIADSQPGPNGEARPFYDFLVSCLRHKAEMVMFEAAHAICNLRDVTARELSPAIAVLQLFLSSSKPVLRFAAVRTLNRVAMTHPMAITNCNIEMEALITDLNRSIATLAISTLLKTGNEGSVDKLLKQIGRFQQTGHPAFMHKADHIHMYVVSELLKVFASEPAADTNMGHILVVLLRGGCQKLTTLQEMDNAPDLMDDTFLLAGRAAAYAPRMLLHESLLPLLLDTAMAMLRLCQDKAVQWLRECIAAIPDVSLTAGDRDAFMTAAAAVLAGNAGMDGGCEGIEEALEVVSDLCRRNKRVSKAAQAALLPVQLHQVLGLV